MAVNAQVLKTAAVGFLIPICPPLTPSVSFTHCTGIQLHKMQSKLFHAAQCKLPSYPAKRHFQNKSLSLYSVEGNRHGFCG